MSFFHWVGIIFQLQFSLGCTVSPQCRLQVTECSSEKWRWLTEEEKWVIVKMPFELMRAVTSCYLQCTTADSLRPWPQSPLCRWWEGHAVAERHREPQLQNKKATFRAGRRGAVCETMCVIIIVYNEKKRVQRDPMAKKVQYWGGVTH